MTGTGRDPGTEPGTEFGSRARSHTAAQDGAGSIPRPALVVLVGASGAGKTSWARRWFATGEVVSSDALRAVVGTGEGDLDASQDAFALLDAVVAARLRRGLTTVIDTLGLDAARRAAAVGAARGAGLPAVAVLVTAPAAVCRARNRLRDRPVPAPALTAQLRRVATLDLSGEGFERVLTVDGAGTEPGGRESGTEPGGRESGTEPGGRVSGTEPGGRESGTEPGGRDGGTDGPVARAVEPEPQPPDATPRPGLRFLLQVSRFPWGEDPRSWLTSIARAAEESGFAGLAVMDHLLQIPQVGRAWDPLPEAYVTLGFLAGVTDRLALGALVTPVTFRSAPVLAKIVATLDAVSGGRAFCGLGAGWYEREHAAYGLPFPGAGARLDILEQTIGTLRAFWGPGTKPVGDLPESTCYPRPGPVRILVGGGGERRTLAIAARLADGCNLNVAPGRLDHKLDVLRHHLAAAGRSTDDFDVTVLDLPVLGSDADDVARLVERHRGPRRAAAFTATHPAGTVADHVARYRALAEKGVGGVFVSPAQLDGPADVERFAPVLCAVG